MMKDVYKRQELKARYGDKHFILKSNKGISIMSGNVNLTRSGKELAKILTPEIEYEYLDRMKDFWKKRKMCIRDRDDTYYKISLGSTEITVKEGGLYIITASITVKADNYDNIWMKILKNGAEEHTMITVANGYTTVQCCTSATLTTNDKISVQLAKSSEGINVTCDGGGYLQLIKLS